MTKIEWTDVSWNPVTGCTPISSGCQNCYARRMAETRLRGRCGYPQDDPFAVTFHPERLSEPFKWRKPRMVFVCSMGDLFHEDTPFDKIAQVYYTMAICYWHTFQVLTKRPQRMQEFYEWVQVQKRGLWWQEFGVLASHLPTDEHEEIGEPYLTYHCNLRKHYFPAIPDKITKLGDAGVYVHWPLPNVWMGVTAENQQTADERIPILLQIPAAVRFVSVEPMLEPVDLWAGEGEVSSEKREEKRRKEQQPVRAGVVASDCGDPVQRKLVDWVICGAETGAGARKMEEKWARDLQRQCEAAGVPFFFKKWGPYYHIDEQIPENWRQWPQDRGQKSENRKQKSDVRGQK